MSFHGGFFSVKLITPTLGVHECVTVGVHAGFTRGSRGIYTGFTGKEFIKSLSDRFLTDVSSSGKSLNEAQWRANESFRRRVLSKRISTSLFSGLVPNKSFLRQRSL